MEAQMLALREELSNLTKIIEEQAEENEHLKVQIAQLLSERATSPSNYEETPSSTPATATATAATITAPSFVAPNSQEELASITDTLINLRTSNQLSNLSHVERVFTDNATLLAPLESICPKIKILLSHLLTNATTMKKQNKAKVSAGSEAARLHDLTDAEARTLGKSFRKFLLGNKETATAVHAWKLDNPILEPLFTELIFEPMIIGIAKELMAASKLGLVKRVVLGGE